MSATPARLDAVNALELIRDGLRQIADGVHLLSIQTPGLLSGRPRLVATTREPETLLTLDEAAEALSCSRRHVERLVAGKPCRRRAGRRVLVERAGLLALLKRG